MFRRLPFLPFLVFLLFAAALAAPIYASELGILADKQFGKAQTATIGAQDRYDAISPAGYGIRGAWEIVNLKVFNLAIAGAYHGKSETDMMVDGKKRGTYGHEYAAVRIQLDWRLLVNLYVGAEMRQEKLSTTVGMIKESSTYSRPWIRGGFGFSIPTPVVKPFVRLEVAYATTKETSTTHWDSLEKALAPEYQVGIYAGIYF